MEHEPHVALVDAHSKSDGRTAHLPSQPADVRIVPGVAHYIPKCGIAPGLLTLVCARAMCLLRQCLRACAVVLSACSDELPIS
jgi:hypothetical protein